MGVVIGLEGTKMENEKVKGVLEWPTPKCVKEVQKSTGGVLSIECKDNLWRPVAFLSKSLNEIERNYEIHDKEMLAIIRGLEA